ncbi:disease resistance protein RUN1-like [Rosa chinensis]|uniref:disease resistance protein RUN1-like n=1 Tax=Rosa chinensis TaxID=74649 RepID=UPI000D08E05F|nr:disease resistance protein RUN1-like [Rosa chinensis]
MASTSSRRRQWKYDVFLSLRGDDTRSGFTDLLYSALNQRGILTFMDDRELEKGKSIRPELLAAIEESRSAIVILSWRYAQDEYTGAAMIERRLCRIKVLVVIDDVDQLTQLEKLAGSHNWIGPESRIIITTTDVQLLKAHDVDATYKADGLNCDEALQLLSLKAFKKFPPPEDYLHLCYHILRYAQGLPLALVASAIDRLKNTPHKRIIEVLRISSDGLDEKDREIFLHIACFYKGKDKDRVTQILDYCQLNPVIGLSVLADRSLITISNNKLWMHDLLQEMGWEIVREQTPKEPGKRSRLWSHEDINNVLKGNKGTDSIQGMVMELTKLQVAHWNPEAFSNLSQLSLLHILNADLPKGLTCLSNSLRLLEWTGYPLRSLPQNFEADELVELNLCHSNIEQLWKGTKNFEKLKLSNSAILKTLWRPQTFCLKVKKIPEFVGNVERLSVLYLDETAIEELPVNVGEMDCFEENDVNSGSAIEMSSTHDLIKYVRGSVFHGCKVVWGSVNKFLPSGLLQKVNTKPMSFRLPISGLCNLTYLNLSNCNLGEGAFGNEFDYFPSLVTLNLSGNNFVRLPSGIGLLSKLENFYLENCKRLQELSDLPSNSILDLRADGCNNMAFEMLKTFMYQAISNKSKCSGLLLTGHSQEKSYVVTLRAIFILAPVVFCPGKTNSFLTTAKKLVIPMTIFMTQATKRPARGEGKLQGNVGDVSKTGEKETRQLGK